MNYFLIYTNACNFIYKLKCSPHIYINNFNAFFYKLSNALNIYNNDPIALITNNIVPSSVSCVSIVCSKKYNAFIKNPLIKTYYICESICSLLNVSA